MRLFQTWPAFTLCSHCHGYCFTQDINTIQIRKLTWQDIIHFLCMCDSQDFSDGRWTVTFKLYFIYFFILFKWLDWMITQTNHMVCVCVCGSMGFFSSKLATCPQEKHYNWHEQLATVNVVVKANICKLAMWMLMMMLSGRWEYGEMTPPILYTSLLKRYTHAANYKMTR